MFKSLPSHSGGWYSTTSTSPSKDAADARASTGALDPPRKSNAVGGASGDTGRLAGVGRGLANQSRGTAKGAERGPDGKPAKTAPASRMVSDTTSATVLLAHTIVCEQRKGFSKVVPKVQTLQMWEL